MMILLFNLFNQPKVSDNELTYSEFMASVEKGEVVGVVMRGPEIHGTTVNGTRFYTFVPNDADLISTLRKRDVSIKVKPLEDSPWYMTLFVSWFPMLLLIRSASLGTNV
jgi:cell division protease FtsH